ncbi:hypothetical protein Metok_0662 [Methanothermococcus okinawensis IH1]|uniref:Uncharacterized protein n=2 Tax=Methanothermococcus okinawensis TaxID=155863 RepID=F8ALT1_METOI|nr:hypothetical protein Metok_0662 [Methanothermococcus okinawensis IH1]
MDIDILNELNGNISKEIKCNNRGSTFIDNNQNTNICNNSENAVYLYKYNLISNILFLAFGLSCGALIGYILRGRISKN